MVLEPHAAAGGGSEPFVTPAPFGGRARVRNLLGIELRPPSAGGLVCSRGRFVLFCWLALLELSSRCWLASLELDARPRRRARMFSPRFWARNARLRSGLACWLVFDSNWMLAL